jgi:hypothetical protein
MALTACGGSSNDGTGPTLVGSGELRSSITKPSDCGGIRDDPYARNLFCPGAFSAAQRMVDEVATSLNVRRPTRGSFHYFQTPDAAAPDNQSQTKIGCLDTTAPWGSQQVVGAGGPLCHLIAYVTSPGPPEKIRDRHGNPVPTTLRAFPDHFGRLFTSDATSLLMGFQIGGAFDPIVRNLGAGARDGFLRDYPQFAPDALYDPDDWRQDAQYYGISGGGGGGWGGELGVLRSGAVTVMLAFGGGGGGGMTSMRGFGLITSRLGGGGGGGMQIADGYRFRDQSFNGLGLGAGFGSDETDVQYSYYDYDGSLRPPQPVHQYNPDVIADYATQVSNLVDQLRAAVAAGETVVLRGGGGMGAGAEYLMQSGDEFEPHALSIQGAFEFRYEFGGRSVPAAAAGGEDDDEGVLAKLGEFYRQATERAYDQCGRDYSNVACMCPATHAIVICLLGQELGDPTKIPGWLQQQHCPNDPNLPNQRVDHLTSYQRVLLDHAGAADDPTCNGVLLQYFGSLTDVT